MLRYQELLQLSYFLVMMAENITFVGVVLFRNGVKQQKHDDSPPSCSRCFFFCVHRCYCTPAALESRACSIIKVIFNNTSYF